MGTRCLTAVLDEKGDEILTMYRHMDGYPDGHGKELKEAFGHVKMVNGLSGDESVANGAGCLAAQIVAHFKTEPGSIYIYPPNARDCGEEYLYVLKPVDADIHMIVYGGPMTAFGFPSKEGATSPIWEGPLSEFDSATADEKYNIEMEKVYTAN
jgi:hypothetical protein